MNRVRFEPIDVTNAEEFQKIYNKLRKIINSTYSDKADEMIPAIRKIYAIDDLGFPINPDADNS